MDSNPLFILLRSTFRNRKVARVSVSFSIASAHLFLDLVTFAELGARDSHFATFASVQERQTFVLHQSLACGYPKVAIRGVRGIVTSANCALGGVHAFAARNIGATFLSLFSFLDFISTGSAMFRIDRCSIFCC